MVRCACPSASSGAAQTGWRKEGRLADESADVELTEVYEFSEEEYNG